MVPGAAGNHRQHHSENHEWYNYLLCLQQGTAMSGAADREKAIAVKSVRFEGFDADYRETVFRGDCIWCEDRGVPFAEADHA